MKQGRRRKWIDQETELSKVKAARRDDRDEMIVEVRFRSRGE